MLAFHAAATQLRALPVQSAAATIAEDGRERQADKQPWGECCELQQHGVAGAGEAAECFALPGLRCYFFSGVLPPACPDALSDACFGAVGLTCLPLLDVNLGAGVAGFPVELTTTPLVCILMVFTTTFFLPSWSAMIAYPPYSSVRM